MNIIHSINQDNINHIIGRLLSQGFFQTFQLNKPLILSILSFANENKIILSKSSVLKISQKYNLPIPHFISVDNFDQFFPVDSHRNQINFLKTICETKTFAGFNLTPYIAKTTLVYFKKQNIFIPENYFSILIKYN